MISELTEITESPESLPPGRSPLQTALQVTPDPSGVCKPPLPDVPFRGWIFYDRDCSLCRRLALRFEKVFERRGFRFEALQEEWVQRGLNLTRDEALEEMRVLMSAGEIFGGADAVVALAREIWWATPLAMIARIAPVQALLDRLYRWVAGHRTCAIQPTHSRGIPGRTRWLALAVLPSVALLTKPFVPAWAFMWIMAMAIFFGCKWLTLGNAVRGGGSAGPFRAACYLLAWPGMSAARFLSSNRTPRLSRSDGVKSSALAIARILLGAVLVFSLARCFAEPILSGWMGMVGMILILHFGLFELASIGWRAMRVDAPPIMNRPLRSTSVSEFWGRRWNAAFNDLAARRVFRPAARAVGPATATLIAFAVSGLIHELVISLPAGAGFGLPTVYFLVQGVGVLAEHSSVGKWLGLGGGICGWLFTMIVVAGPAFWLFHPPFVRNVILPFMRVIGAL
ncbi:MAG TPA: DCC1-like thiol-disulfide oxidoreductase family protein [Chthoniobacterales bacterium]|nr:DCC1-like thiol-disulfide oxidoreductase family protein [Chthoniobacterales bacterium]